MSKMTNNGLFGALGETLCMLIQQCLWEITDVKILRNPDSDEGRFAVISMTHLVSPSCFHLALWVLVQVKAVKKGH
jgi:hypothetical protein